ncbi:uncharacterized protein C15orf39 homolog [Oncorhynchus mykiss]|uniref:Uncharacterized protein n=1 Tax=Oncorhynchus mykiss TaxID=8022 RepID=A0A8K9XFN5_ONCMY|nr:uncharacterized protein C15orf39 homolog [Oncorhynchus mykiss]
MMSNSSKRVQPSFTVAPVVQSKMPRLEGSIIGSVASTEAGGLSKPASLAHYPSAPHHTPQTQALQNRAYFTYDLGGHDLSDPDLRPSWSPSEGLLLNRRNVGVSPQSVEEGSLRNHIVYSRAETFSTESSSVSGSNSVSATAQDTPAKQGFTYYTRSPGGLRSPTSGPGTIAMPIAVRKQPPVGGVSLSPQSENSVCLSLAVPKPLYGHPSPCCSELGCTVGQRHSLEQRGGVHRIHPHLNLYEGWMYSPSSHHHPRALQPEHGVETERLSDRLPLKDGKDHQHHPNGIPNRAVSAQRFPVFMEPTYSIGYPCAPARAVRSPSSFTCDPLSSQLGASPYGADQCQRLQIPSKRPTYHSLVSSHPSCSSSHPSCSSSHPSCSSSHPSCSSSHPSCSSSHPSSHPSHPSYHPSHPSHPSCHPSHPSPPSHPFHPTTYKPMTPLHHGVPVTSQVYQGRSSPNVAKYSQLPVTQPIFYYHPQANVEGESESCGAGFKDAGGGMHRDRDWEDVMVSKGSKRPLPPSPTQTGPHLASHLPSTATPTHYHVTQSMYSTDVPMSSHMAPSSHPYLRSFDQPSYHQLYRMPLNAAGQMRAPAIAPERPCASPSPPSSLQRTERPLDYSLPQYRSPVTSPQVSSPRRHHLSRGHSDSTLPGAPLTVSTTLSRADYGHHNHPANHHHHHSNNHATTAMCTTAVNYGNHHTTTANQNNHQHTTTRNHHNATCQGMTGSTVVRLRDSPVPQSNVHGDMITTGTEMLKRWVSDSDRPINIDSPSPKHTQDNGDDVIDVELYQKRQKMKTNGEGDIAEGDIAEGDIAEGDIAEGDIAEGDIAEGGRAEVNGEGGGLDSCLSPSPPMPVINNVFSLAPYKAYLEAAGMLSLPVRGSQRTDRHPSGHCVLKPETQSDPHRRHQHRQETGPTSDPHRPERDPEREEGKPVSINHRIGNHVVRPASEQQRPVVQQRILGIVVRSDTTQKTPVVPVFSESPQEPEREVEVKTADLQIKVVKEEEEEPQQEPEREVEVKTDDDMQTKVVIKEEEEMEVAAATTEPGVFVHDLTVGVIKKCESDQLDSKLSIASDKYISIMSATDRRVMEGSFTYNEHHHQSQTQHHHQSQTQHHHQSQTQHHQPRSNHHPSQPLSNHHPSQPLSNHHPSQSNHHPSHPLSNHHPSQPQSNHHPSQPLSNHHPSQSNHHPSQPLSNHYPPNPPQPHLRPKSTTPPQPLSIRHRIVGAFTHNVHHPPQAHQKPYDQTATPHPKSSSSPQSTNPATTKLNLQNIPPQCLKLSTYKIVLPDNMLRAVAPPPCSTEVPQSPTDPTAVAKSSRSPHALSDSNNSSRPARQHFLELHLLLCNLVSSCVSHTPPTELQTWLSQLDISLTSTAISPPKAQKVTSLLGSEAREVWLRGPETQAALQNVLQRLGQYVAQKQCPFPHVMRAGAVFVPMLVVKELLFPQVQGVYIDQVLQEHKVELRPTTLSEERHLVTLQKRPCSSKLRRLLSLKHLPNIYPDVLNLYYHSCVCKSLGVEPCDTARTPEGMLCSEDRWNRSASGLCSLATNRCDIGTQTTTSPQHLEECISLSPSQTPSCRATASLSSHRPREDPKRGSSSSSHFKMHKRKEGKGKKKKKKSFPKPLFVGTRVRTVLEGGGNTEQAGDWSILKNTVNQEEEERNGRLVWSSDNAGSDSDRRDGKSDGEKRGKGDGERNGGNKLEEEEEPPATPLLEEEEEESNSWTCPLTSDELSSSPSNRDRASTLLAVPSYKTPSSGSAWSQGLRTKSQSGMILKLRKVLFPEGRKGQQTRYQAVSVSDTELRRHSQPPLSDSQPLLSETEDGESRRKRDREGDRGEARERTRDGCLSRRMSSKLPQRGLHFGGFSSTLRHLTTFSSFSRLPSSLSSSLRRSVMKIKYCPFLSACHSSDHRRRRWILRSAVQRARSVMKIYYPDLVGRRIQHLYEEGDGTEVWYRGLVVQVHEPHPNPLKTVFQVKYDSEPEWQYYLELLIDYKKGWLKIED